MNSKKVQKNLGIGIICSVVGLLIMLGGMLGTAQIGLWAFGMMLVLMGCLYVSFQNELNKLKDKVKEDNRDTETTGGDPGEGSK